MDELPLAPDQALLERLQRSVEFLEHARSHVPNGTAIDRMVAVHGLDNSVEYLLRIVLDAFDVEARTAKNLDTVELASLAGEVNEFLRTHYDIRLPYRTEIKKLRQLRNLVQHGMLDPLADLASLSTIVTRFYDHVFTNLFGMMPEELRLSKLIHDPLVRGFLAAAEEHIDSKEFLESVVSSRDAFDNALFERRRYSSLRLSAIPALLEHDTTTTAEFFSGLVDEVERLRFGLDATRFERFQEYVRHIPHEYDADWHGNIVMQRPWIREDAEFCYRFVAQTVLQWQNSTLDPIYEGSVSDLPEWIHHLAGISIPDGSHSLTYDLGPQADGQIEVFQVGEPLKRLLGELPLKREYDFVSEHLEKGVVKSRFFHRVELKNRIVRLLTHNPLRWEVILYKWPVPLTWYRQDFEEGSLKTETPCINTATDKEIVEIYPDLITEEVAAQIIAVREQQGRFRTRQDVRQVPGITEEQVEWICRFTRAESAAPVSKQAEPL